MWQTTCNNVEYDFGENQGVFKDVSQCVNNVSPSRLACTSVAQGHLHASSFLKAYSRPTDDFLQALLRIYIAGPS